MTNNPLKKSFDRIILESGTHEFILSSIKECKEPSYEDKNVLEDKIRFSFYTELENGKKAWTFKTCYPSVGSKGKKKTKLHELGEKLADILKDQWDTLTIDQIWESLQLCINNKYFIEVEATDYGNKFKQIVTLPKQMTNSIQTKKSEPVAQQQASTSKAMDMDEPPY